MEINNVPSRLGTLFAGMVSVKGSPGSRPPVEPPGRTGGSTGQVPSHRGRDALHRLTSLTRAAKGDERAGDVAGEGGGVQAQIGRFHADGGEGGTEFVVQRPDVPVGVPVAPTPEETATWLRDLLG